MENNQNVNTPVMLAVNHVSKSFKLPTEQVTGLKQAFINRSRGVKGYRVQEVLKDISFEVQQGDFFGIVGRNGSGKSTLLKLISQIYQPESGSIKVNGTLVPFIELGVGFNPELTGRENVYLNGALLGFSHREIEAMYDDIVAFAELEDFMDQKLKNYSSGMQVRLAFSVAIKAQGDILVLDEVLAVGDEAFQRKCNDFFHEIKKDPTKTVILVTHDMSAVKKYCTKAIFLRDGYIEVEGDVGTVADAYSLQNLEMPAPSIEESTVAEKYAPGLSTTIPYYTIHPRSPLQMNSGETFSFDVEYECTKDIDHYLVLTLLDSQRGGIIFDSTSRAMPRKGRGKYRESFSLPLNIFTSSTLTLYSNIRVENPQSGETDMIAFTNDHNTCTFTVRHEGHENYALLNSSALTFTQIDSQKSDLSPHSS